jgi:hypothetical protein
MAVVDEMLDDMTAGLAAATREHDALAHHNLLDRFLTQGKA